MPKPRSWAEPAPDAPADGIYAYPFFTSYVRSLLFDENNPYGCSYADLFKGGLTIYTSLDPELQDAAQAAVDNQRANMADNLDASIVAIDVATGQVKAMTRGVPYGQGEGESQVNIATGDGGTGRQAGSTFKAFTLAAAIEQGISPQTLVDCTSPSRRDRMAHPRTSRTSTATTTASRRSKARRPSRRTPATCACRTPSARHPLPRWPAAWA